MNDKQEPTIFATADDWRTFLRPVVFSVRNTPSDADYSGRCSALAYAMRVHPSDLTEARCRELCRKSEFWPSVADIEAVFREVWRDKARSAAITPGVPRLASPAQPETRSPDEIAAIQAKLAAFKAEVAADRPTSTRTKPTASHLTPAQLKAAYAEIGTDAARLRAQTLEEQGF